MKRKISIAVLLSLVAALALVALAGCSDAGKQAAIDAYKEAAAATSAAKNVKYDIDFDCTASVAGISAKIDGDANVHYAIPDDLNKLLESQFAADTTINVDAIVEELNMTAGAYYKDSTLYYNVDLGEINGEKTEPIKGFIKLPEETGDMLAKALDNVNLEEMAASLESDLPKFESYVTSGSYANGRIEMAFDTIRYLKDVAAATAKKSGSGFEEAMQAVAQIDQYVKSCDTRIVADLNADMTFKSVSMTVDLTIDGGAMDSSMPGDMEISLKLNCPKISLDPAQKVEFPSFEGYEDQSEMLGGLFGTTSGSTDGDVPATEGYSGSFDAPEDISPEELMELIEGSDLSSAA